MNIVEFVEEVMDVKLFDYQKKFLTELYDIYEKDLPLSTNSRILAVEGLQDLTQDHCLLLCLVCLIRRCIMQIVIEIDEEIYNDIKQGKIYRSYRDVPQESVVAIANGIVLPKGHGRLIILSEDAVKREQTPLRFSCQNWISEVGLSNATVAIIEADKEYEVEVVTRGNCMICGKELTEGLFFCKECRDKANGGK